jgi:toxin CptA
MKGPDLTIEIGASRRLTYVVAAIHLLAVGAVLLAELSWVYREPIFVAIGISLGMVLKTRARQGLKLRCQPDGNLDVWTANDWQEASLLPDTLVLPWCGILRYQRSVRRRPETCVILPDSLNGDDFRRLRVWLRFRAAALPKSAEAS